MAAEVVGLALSFQQTGDRWYLKQMLDAMELGIPELRQNVLQPDSHLLQFVNNIDGSPTEEMAEKALEVIQHRQRPDSHYAVADPPLPPGQQDRHQIQPPSFVLGALCSSIEEAQQPLDDTKAKEIAPDTEKFVSKALELE
ncbi:hypothetical protein KCU73_g7791, partial [Aureobasidium melanogenum]